MSFFRRTRLLAVTRKVDDLLNPPPIPARPELDRRPVVDDGFAADLADLLACHEAERVVHEWWSSIVWCPEYCGDEGRAFEELSGWAG